MRLRRSWIVVPIASMVACTGTVKGASVISAGLAHFVSPEGGQALERVMPVQYRAGTVLALAAIAFVLAGTWAAPRNRPIVAVLLYCVGAYLAWLDLRSWFIPEGYPLAYQPSRVPLALTLAGGLAAVLVVMGFQLLTTFRNQRRATSIARD